jgi:putative hydrolase of the HAD superfamily
VTHSSTTRNPAECAAPSGGIAQPQTLLIDADDTLWENNVYFERAIAQFISFLNHRTYTPAQVREVLNEVERENIVRHGYGLHSFAHALVDTFEKLTVDPITPELHAEIHRIAHEIAEHPVQLIEGVPETLAYLASRHHLLMVTKGDVTEQSGKVERSGLGSYFAAIEIVAEKNVSAYQAVVEKYALALERTWMVGNSPKSDINPALSAGVNAVFVPHDNTWILEHEDVLSGGFPGKLLTLTSFRDLRRVF